MKRFIFLLLSITIVSSCQENTIENLPSDQNTALIKISPSNFLSFEDQNIEEGRIENTPAIDFILIEVRDLSANGNPLYATGAFSFIPDTISLSVNTQNRYNIKVNALGTGERYKVKYFTDQNMIMKSGINIDITDSMDYSSTPKRLYTEETGQLTLEDLNTEASVLGDQIDLFYGELPDISADSSDHVINMIRHVFGTEVAVENFYFGKLEFKFHLFGLVINPGDSTYFQINAMGALPSDSEPRRVKVDYVYTDQNDTEITEVIYDQQVVFNRLKKKIININMNQQPEDTVLSANIGVAFSFADQPILPGDTLKINGSN